MADNKWRSLFGPIAFLKDDAKVEGRRRGVIYFDLERGVPASKDEGGTAVSLTIWETLKDVELTDGDFVYVRGSTSTNVKETDDGETIVYYNLSVQEIGVLALTRAPKRDGGSGNGTPERKVENKRKREPAF